MNENLHVVHLEDDDRKAVFFANFSGDIRHALGEIKGPNQMGELMTVVEASYDTIANTTRLGFALTTSHDVERVVEQVTKDA